MTQVAPPEYLQRMLSALGLKGTPEDVKVAQAALNLVLDLQMTGKYDVRAMKSAVSWVAPPKEDEQ